MFEYVELQTTVIVLMGVCSAIILIDKVVEVFKKMASPEKDVMRRLAEHDEMLGRDHKELAKQNEAIRLLVRGVSQLMTHEIDGNHVDQLERTRDEMNEFLINRM